MQFWYRSRVTWWGWCLYPLSLLFKMISALRRWLYGKGLMTSTHAGACTLVVGNLSVGGNGKTPVVVALAQYFFAKGWRPGIVSRGYGGDCKTFPYNVTVDDNAKTVGDEPLLMKLRTDCAVVIDPLRSRGASYLVKHFGCNLILCDDGLQHYALSRDIEVVVMDERQLGNGWLLPMGPLRESAWRLATVDAIVHNGNAPMLDDSLVPLDRQHRMTLVAAAPKRIVGDQTPSSINALNALYAGMNALAGIGNPQRFFDTLKQLGLNMTQQLAFKDHHHFAPTDIPAKAVIMTEKDAVKVKPFAHADAWYLPVSAELPTALYDKLEALVREYESTEKNHGNKY